MQTVEKVGMKLNNMYLTILIKKETIKEVYTCHGCIPFSVNGILTNLILVKTKKKTKIKSDSNNINAIIEHSFSLN